MLVRGLIFVFLFIFGNGQKSSSEEVPSTFTGNKDENCDLFSSQEWSSEEENKQILLTDSDGNVCLQGNLNMHVTICDEESMMDITKETHDSRVTKRDHRLHVDTNHYEGVCFGESKALGGYNFTGPALYFAWNDTYHRNQVWLLWKVDISDTFLETIIVNVQIPLHHDSNEIKQNIYGIRNNLRLFNNTFGSDISIQQSQVPLYGYEPMSKIIERTSVFSFECGDMVISGLEESISISITLAAVLTSAALLMMMIGAYFFYCGSREKIRNRQKNTDYVVNV